VSKRYLNTTDHMPDQMRKIGSDLSSTH